MADKDTKDPTGTPGYRRRQNMAASVRSRLTMLAHTEGEEPEYVLTRYALERLLYRLGKSSYAGAFILKGALLFALWEGEGHPHRATRDLDLLGFELPDVSRIEQVFRELCMLPVEDDGLNFLPETIHARPIREQQEYGGIRVLLQATLGTARLRVQADVGFGDVVTPADQGADLPTLLDLPGLPAPHLRVYPRETVVAEKFEAMVRLGLSSSHVAQDKARNHAPCYAPRDDCKRPLAVASMAICAWLQQRITRPPLPDMVRGRSGVRPTPR